MNQTFLIDMIDRRDTLLEQRALGPAAIERLREDVEHDAAQALRRAVEHLRAAEVRPAAERLVVRRYLQRLLDEIDAIG